MPVSRIGPGRPVDPTKDREILAAGRRILFGQGPQAVTMESVARAAGVAKPTLYRRYANRDRLIEAIVESEAERMAGRFRIAPASAADFRRSLQAFGVDLARFLLSAEHIGFIHALGASTGMPQALRDTIFRHGPLNTRNRLADWLKKADAAGLLCCPRPEASAERFLGMLMGLDLVRTLYHVAREPDPEVLDARVESIVDDFLILHRRSDSPDQARSESMSMTKR
jgi:TetR/AcrR family transcriptional repressor of mexJK operon